MAMSRINPAIATKGLIRKYKSVTKKRSPAKKGKSVTFAEKLQGNCINMSGMSDYLKLYLFANCSYRAIVARSAVSCKVNDLW